MVPNTDIAQLLEKHRALDAAIEDNREHFLSDWNGNHPFVERFLGPELMNLRLKEPVESRYIYFEEEDAVLDAVCNLHLKLEELDLSRRNILAGPGSSPALVALSLWLRQQGYDEVYYLPPLYYTFHFFLRLLDIRLRPVSGKQVFESNFLLNLPNRRTVLLLCDPVWYAGRRVPMEKLIAIAEWQRLTNSLVLIDGSFQYMQWDGTRREYSSILEPELTFRLISPTKSLGIPFFRFAYLLHPSRFHDDLLFLYENIVGGAGVSDLAFARRALEVLSSDTSNNDLTTFLGTTYTRLLEKDLIQSQITPECGYFVFVIPKVKLARQVVMGQDYFELKNYPDYVRINLMAAHRIYFQEQVVVPDHKL